LARRSGQHEVVERLYPNAIHLRVRLEAGYFDHPLPREDPPIIESEAHQHLALEMAQKSIILAKNESMLPLDKTIRTLALIGPSARRARTGGGGSSRVEPWHTVSPYEGLVHLLGDTVDIKYAEGVEIDTRTYDPIPSRYLRTPDGQHSGLLGQYYDNQNFAGEPVFTRIDSQINFSYRGNGPDPRLPSDHFSVRWTGQFIAPVTDAYTLVVSSDDGSRLYVDGDLVIDNWGDHAEFPKTCRMPMQAGQSYAVKIEYYETMGDACVRFAWEAPGEKVPEPSIEDAVALARDADAAIICVGNTWQYESEGRDVEAFQLTGDQDALVRAVARANPNTVVVVYGGVPVLMRPWIDRVEAVLIAGYPGQEGGDALAQILLGKINPSGKLPYSYIQSRDQSPAFEGYQDAGLKVHYHEGIFVGYRYYDKHHITPLFPFGHGLSYTSFAYNNLRIRQTGDLAYAVSLDVKNTGDVAGEEVVQLYIGQPECSVERPVKELKGFAKVRLEPGQAKTVSMSLNARSFQFFHPGTHQWTVEPGRFDIQVGASSRDIRLRDSIKL